MHCSPNTEIIIIANCHADLLEIIIEDNGGGFKDVDVKNVFRKFSRKRNHESAGSGLGLSIVKGFTEALNGTVELEKENDISRFSVLIPVKTSHLKFAGSE